MEQKPTNLYGDAMINTLRVNTIHSSALFARVQLQGKKIRCQINCGATENALPKSDSSCANSVNLYEAVSMEQCHSIRAQNSKMDKFFALKFIIVHEIIHLCWTDKP